MRLILFIPFFIISICAYSQGENNLWLFSGGAGIDFNNSPPTYTVGNSLVRSGRSTCSISDATGKLLFYSDGEDVWNRNHDIMPNGDRLRGDNDTRQSVVITAYPGSTGLYFLFTLDSSGRDRLLYNIIDMSLDNGLGDVTAIKNEFIDDAFSEGMALARSECGDIWLVVRKKSINQFYSYKITEEGIDFNPVVSQITPLTPERSVGEPIIFDSKFTKILTSDGNQILSLYDFDRFSGLVEYNQKIESLEPTNHHDYCFSADGKYVYSIQERPTDEIPETVQLVQYYLEESSINRSRFVILTTSGEDNIFGALSGNMQLGPDGLIYYWGDKFKDSGPFINAIQSPIKQGDIPVIIENAVDLSSAGFEFTFVSFYNNPPVLAVQEEQLIDRIGDIILCQDKDTIITLPTNAIDIIWSDGSTASSHTFSEEDSYAVSYKQGDCMVIDSFNITYINSPIISLDFPITECSDSIVLSVNINSDTYLWSTGASTPAIKVNTSGIYSIEVTVKECILRDTIQVTIGDQNPLDIGDMILTCNTDPITLMSNIDGDTYSWNTGEDTPIIEVTATGSYTLEVESTAGCIYRDTIDIVFDELLVDLGADQAICIGDSTILSAPSPETLSSIVWSDGSEDPDLIVRSADSYWLAIERGMCFASDTIMISFGVCDMIPDSMMTDTMMIDTMTIDNLMVDTMMTQVPGKFIPDDDCSVYIPNAISAGASQPVNRLFQIFSNCALSSINIKIYDRWGNLHYQISDTVISDDDILIQPGVYVAKVEYRFEDGDEVEQVLQSVTVL